MIATTHLTNDTSPAETSLVVARVGQSHADSLLGLHDPSRRPAALDAVGMREYMFVQQQRLMVDPSRATEVLQRQREALIPQPPLDLGL